MATSNAFKLKTLKKHPALIPLVIFIGAGAVMAAAYGYRLAVYSPEVMWNKRNNPEPWNDYEGKQYKLVNIGVKYDADTGRPKF